MKYGFINNSGVLYRLIERKVTLRGDKESTMYYFVKYSKPLKRLEHEADLPDGYDVYEDQYGYPRVIKGMKHENNHN